SWSAKYVPISRTPTTAASATGRRLRWGRSGSVVPTRSVMPRRRRTPPGTGESVGLGRVFGHHPRLVRVVLLDRGREPGRVRPEVLLVNDTVVVDLEGLNSRHPVVRRPGHRGEASDHHALHHVVASAQAGGGSLCSQDAEVVAVEGLRLVRVALGQRLGDALAEGSSGRAVL